MRTIRWRRSEKRDKNWWNAKRYALAYRRLRAAIEDRDPLELGLASRIAPTLEEQRAHVSAARALRQRTQFVSLLLAGEPLEDVVVTFVRDRIAARDHVLGRSLSQSLQAHPTTHAVGSLGSAIVATAMGLPDLAWASFRDVPAALWRRLAPGDFIRTAFQVDRIAAVDEVGRLIRDMPTELRPDGWLTVVRIAFGAREERLAAEVFEVAEALARKSPDAWAHTQADRDWLRPWFDKVLRPALPVEVPAAHVSLAVLDYKQPDSGQTSANIGDYVQTLASLGHAVRHRDVRFHGPRDLVDLMAELRARVRPESRLDGAARDVMLVPVHRDATGYDPVPEDTWAIAFGWYMQSIFGRYDFPLHPNLRPIFISFHCNRAELLTPEAIAYLRTYGPVGCRDWTTVDLLTSAGVPAFFSGCITTTARTLFPELDPGERPDPKAPIAYVDTPAADGTTELTQAAPEVRHTDLATNLRDAIARLEAYRRRYSAVVTSRLHCYLPARSIGAAARFVPKNPADIRFNGLLELTDDDFDRMRRGIDDKLAAVFEAILAGRGAAEVYAAWRTVCARDVSAAQARLAGVPPMPLPSFDVAEACAAIRSRAVGPGPADNEVHVALALDGNLKDELTVVVEAMASNCSRPLHLWILCRDHGPEDFARIARLFPEVGTTWLPCDAVDYGPILGMLNHITVSTMDRLLLPELLPELDRIVYHDLDALPLGDVAQLYGWDLHGNPLAARSAIATHVLSGFSNVGRSAKRFREDPTVAYELLQRMYARHEYDYRSFNAGILVLDLSRMRADGFCREFIPFVERYGMNDQEVLNCYAGPHRAVLPPRWNAIPTQEPVTDPLVIHWAGPLKPWKRDYVVLREVWAEYADRVRRRA